MADTTVLNVCWVKSDAAVLHVGWVKCDSAVSTLTSSGMLLRVRELVVLDVSKDSTVFIFMA